MVDFSRHSLKNFTEQDKRAWIKEGIHIGASALGFSDEQMNDLITTQEEEIAKRKLHQTIEDSSDERKELRRRILGDYIQLYAGARKDSQAIIVLGQIASGKSSLTQRLAYVNESAIVDVDFIKQGHGFMTALREDFDEGRGVDMIHEEASMLSKEYLNIMSNFGYNLVIPKAGTNYDSIRNILVTLKTKGYQTTLVYIDLPIEKCVARNYYRFADELRRGIPSRLIPFDVIEAIDDKPFKTFARFLSSHSPYVDNYAAFSNDVNFDEELIPIDLREILSYYNSEEEEKEEDD